MSDGVKQAVILAGGIGTRLRPYTEEHPKPMFPINNKPFIDYLFDQIRGFGIRNVLVLLGYKAQEIIDHISGTQYEDILIEYSVTPLEYDTGDRLKNARDMLEDRFLLMYCDNYCPINFARLEKDSFENDAEIQLTVYANRDKYTKDNVRINKDGKVTEYDKSRIAPDLSGVDIGYAIVRKHVMDLLPETGGNFEKAVYPLLVNDGRLYATLTEHRYYSIGSWERIELTKQFFKPQKTVFLDRDGTINVRPPKACYVERPEDFVWIPGSMEAIEKLKQAGFRVILISNQPGIARGRLTDEMLGSIHEKMQTELERCTGYCIDKIYYCPHDWDEGCFCRKPKPGLLFQAQRDYSLDLTRCVFFGDDERDMYAAFSAGCKGYLVDDEHPLLDLVDECLKKEIL